MKLVLLSTVGFALIALLLIFGSARPEHAEAGTFTELSSGATGSCALVSSGGAVKCWGWNEFGQLGIGTKSAPYTQSTLAIPVCATGVWDGSACAGGSTFASYGLSTGSAASHRCGLIVYLIVKCWGRNVFGQVGNGASGDPVLNPTTVQCQGSSTYCASPNYILAGVGQVAAGDDHTCALDFGGYVWCWGRNHHGQLGDGTTTSRSYATRVCASGSGLDCTGGSLLSGAYGLTAGLDHTCIYTSSGAAKCWGANHEGQLGDDTTTSSSLPVSVSGLSSGVTAVSGGEWHTCAVVSGGAECWGSNVGGQLGNDTTTDSTTPVTVCATGSGSCGSLSNVSQISAGGAHTCALRTSSPYVVCWGWQYLGSLGNGVPFGTIEFQERPMAWTVPSWGEPQPTSLSVGNTHSCVLISSYAQCWGWNAFGQLGNGTTTDSSTWIGHDTDKDGCIDAYELGPNHAYGGQRDPTNFYDFFDTPNDARTTLANAMTSSSPTLPAWIGVGAITGFPTASASEPKTLWIDGEVFKYTDQRTSPSVAFDVTARAQQGSAASSHASGATIVSNWRDKMIDSADAPRVIARFYATGTPANDPLTPPPPTPQYHPAFDRQDDPNSSEAWDLIVGDGQITIGDVAYVNYQSGDTCATPTATLTPTPTP